MQVRSRWRAVAGFAAIGLVSGAMGVLAQADKEAILKTRQETMKSNGKNVAAVKAYGEGKGEQSKALESASALVAVAPKIPDLFPPGTGPAEFPGKTAAKAVVWTERDKFTAAAKNLGVLAQSLVDVVKSGDQTKVTAQVQNVISNGCTGCHDTFREKKQ
jgi:cytochrome c556